MSADLSRPECTPGGPDDIPVLTGHGTEPLTYRAASSAPSAKPRRVQSAWAGQPNLISEWRSFEEPTTILCREGAATVRRRDHDDVVLRPGDTLTIPADEDFRYLAGSGGATLDELSERSSQTSDRRERPIGRRIVLGMTGLGVLGIVAGARLQSVVGRALESVSPEGQGLAGLVPGADRFRIYTVTGTIPEIPVSSYKLTVDGLVDKPLLLSYGELTALPEVQLVKPFQCVTGWRVPGVSWTGVALATLLDRVGVKPEATGVEFYSADGIYTESLTLDQARRYDVIVAHTMYGKPLRAEHGGPVRLYVAPMYGYKSIKWLNRISLVSRTTPGFWEQEGYAVNAWIGRSNGRSDAPVD